MGYGHRPMFPEYYPRKPTYRDLAFLEGGYIYDNMGRQLAAMDSVNLIDWLCCHNTNLFAGSFLDMDILPLLQEMAFDPRARILCTKEGRPILARIQAGKQTRWLVSSRSWGNAEGPGSERGWLQSMADLYCYYGLGYCPTPSSLGVQLMRYTYAKNNFQRHSSCNRAVEEFIRNNAVGGIVATPFKRRRFAIMSMLDMASAWVSSYTLHPTGTAERINEQTNLNDYFEAFVECEIFIPRRLPLGPFPIRTNRKSGQRVIYPTEEGVYKNVYLWKIQIDDCHRAGCLVSCKGGWGWRESTTDNSEWAKYAYEKRQGANNGFIAVQAKAINVAPIGRMFRSREGYILKGDTGNRHEGCLGETQRSVQIVNSNREPVNLYVVPDVDQRSALMPHWYAYTIARCNSHVYNFALPYAKAGTLAMIDYDSIMTTMDVESMFIHKKSAEAKHVPYGTWLYTQLHNVHILNHRSFSSDEITKMPGVMR